jgi:hypothetical protein
MQTITPGTNLSYWLGTIFALSLFTIVALVNVPRITKLLPKIRGWQDGFLDWVKDLGHGGGNHGQIGEDVEENDAHDTYHDDDGIELEQQNRRNQTIV